MADQESQAGRAQKPSSPSSIPSKFDLMGSARIDEFINLQTELLERFQEINRKWLDRAQLEATMASEFASKLASLRSLPEVMTVYQDWTTRRLEMMAEDGKHLLADTQKFIETGARFASNGWAGRRQ
jgi:Phasin protein